MFIPNVLGFLNALKGSPIKPIENNNTFIDEYGVILIPAIVMIISLLIISQSND